MRVFVLNAGHCGSTTFAHACRHLTNYTSGHETRARAIGLEDRLSYPDWHIEVDNRLTWFLPLIGQRHPAATYVYLRRDPAAVAASYLRRWDQHRSNIARAFGHGIVIKSTDYSVEQRAELCRMYVDTANSLIDTFLESRDHMTVRVEAIDADFPAFLDQIGAEGDLHSAMAEWNVRHNATADWSAGSPV